MDGEKVKIKGKTKKREIEDYDPNHLPNWALGMEEKDIKEVYELSKLKPHELCGLIQQEFKEIYEQSLWENKEIARAKHLGILKYLKKK